MSSMKMIVNALQCKYAVPDGVFPFSGLMGEVSGMEWRWGPSNPLRTSGAGTVLRDSIISPRFEPEIAFKPTVRYTDSGENHGRQQMNAISYAVANRELAATMDRVIDDHEPVIITREETEPVIMMSLDDFNSIQETMYLLGNPANAEHLRKSIAELDAGKGIKVSLDDL
jgi:antitoxin YefM